MMDSILICVPERDRVRVSTALRSQASGLRFVQSPELPEALRRPPAPSLLIIHADTAGDFTASRLMRLRRNASPALKRVPVLALAGLPAQQDEWSQAGAAVAKPGLAGGALVKACEEALAMSQRWVDSLAYVGPDRRRKKAMFNKAARRLEDSPHLVRKPDSAQENEKVASVDTTHPLATLLRRLRIAGQSLVLEDRDARARFLSDVRAARSKAVMAGRTSLARSLAELEQALANAGASGKVDTHRIDALLYRAQEEVSA